MQLRGTKYDFFNSDIFAGYYFTAAFFATNMSKVYTLGCLADK